jgi:hypothetical protein
MVATEAGIARERELLSNDEFWGVLYKRGSRAFRLANNLESSLDVVRYILRLHQKVTLDIQDEIVNRHCEIDETAAAHELNAEIIRERQKHT